MPRRTTSYRLSGYSLLPLIFLLIGGFFYWQYPEKEQSLFIHWLLAPSYFLPREGRVILSGLVLIGVLALFYRHITSLQDTSKRQLQNAPILIVLSLLCLPNTWLHPLVAFASFALLWAYHLAMQLFEARDNTLLMLKIGLLLGIAILLRPSFLLYTLLFIGVFLILKALSWRSFLAYILGVISPPILLLPFVFSALYKGELSIDLMQWVCYYPIWHRFELTNLPMLSLCVLVGLVILDITTKLFATHYYQKKETTARIRSTLLLLCPFVVSLLYTALWNEYIVVSLLVLGILYSYLAKTPHPFGTTLLYILLITVVLLTFYLSIAY